MSSVQNSSNPGSLTAQNATFIFSKHPQILLVQIRIINHYCICSIHWHPPTRVRCARIPRITLVASGVDRDHILNCHRCLEKSSAEQGGLCLCKLKSQALQHHCLTNGTCRGSFPPAPGSMANLSIKVSAKETVQLFINKSGERAAGRHLGGTMSLGKKKLTTAQGDDK